MQKKNKKKKEKKIGGRRYIFWVCWLRKPEKVEKCNQSSKQKKNVSLQANISDTPFDQKSLGHPEVVDLQRHRATDRRTLRLYD